MALLSPKTLGNLKIFTKAPKSLWIFPGNQESKLQLALLNKKGNGGRKEVLDDSEKPEWTLLPEATGSFYLMVTSFASESTGPVGSMRLLTLGEGVTSDE